MGNDTAPARRCSYARATLCVFVFACVAPARLAGAFVPVSPAEPIATSPRWSAASHASTAGRGLRGGLTVAVTPGLAETLLTAVLGTYTEQDVRDTHDAIVAAFAAWESPVLAFRVTFDGPAVRGETVGEEIDLFAVPATDPDFVGTPFFGLTKLDWTSEPARLLTNGTVVPGLAAQGADILFNVDSIAAFSPIFPDRNDKRRALQRLVMHEIGHALGLHHPQEFPAFNWDTNSDPLDAMVIDPTDPFAGLVLSPAYDPDAVMDRITATFPDALLRDSLANDDRGGRDVLYPALPTAMCPPVPRNHCRTAATSSLVVGMPADPGKRKLEWKWTKGAATTLAALGDPLAGRSYGLCIYDGSPARLLQTRVPADALRWRPTKATGFAYKDPAAAKDGIAKIKLHAGVAGKASASVVGKGAALPVLALGSLAGPLTVQLVNQESPVCFETAYAAGDVVVKSGTLLKAKRE